MSKSLISIIIPTYNEEEHISNCLNSISKQKMKDKIEVILVDDNSADKTIEIAKSFSKKIKIKIIKNGTKDPERGKKIGLDKVKSQFFMYLDADMEYSSDDWFNQTVKPLIENKQIVGSLAAFKPKSSHPPITRCISYDLFQRDPIMIKFTTDIKDTFIKEKEDYFVCKFSANKIPAQSLCLYRSNIIKSLFKDSYHLMDNDVPVTLVEKGYFLFALSKNARVYHYLLKDAKELFKKRMKGVLRTYVKNFPQRKYKWLNLSSKRNVFRLALWIISANVLLPSLLTGIKKSFKTGDLACLNEPIINLVSTDSLIIGFLKSNLKFKDLFKI